MSVKVLLVAANPLDTGRPALDEEMRSIRANTPARLEQRRARPRF
ncbi:hypothetical protein [Streptomyces sp. NPDC059010]